jgi:RimJ/RimL family protein N-acetyltransferase
MSDKIPGPAYRIETARLVIRCWNPGDATQVQAVISQNLEHLRPWLPWTEHEPQELQQKIDLLRRFRGEFDLEQDFTYGIFNRAESQVLGGTGLHLRLGPGAREIGYWIHKDYINQGLATESSAALTKVAFEVDGVNRVEIHCDPHNIRSAAVPKKLGFSHEATLRQRIPLAEGGWRDMMIWTLLADTYPSSPAALAEIEAFDVIGRKIL